MSIQVSSKYYFDWERPASFLIFLSDDTTIYFLEWMSRTRDYFHKSHNRFFGWYNSISAIVQNIPLQDIMDTWITPLALTTITHMIVCWLRLVTLPFRYPHFILAVSHESNKCIARVVDSSYYSSISAMLRCTFDVLPRIVNLFPVLVSPHKATPHGLDLRVFVGNK